MLDSHDSLTLVDQPSTASATAYRSSVVVASMIVTVAYALSGLIVNVEV
jgi:hypothetical protein